MSYNITSWKTKLLDRLVIPKDELQFSEDMQRRGWKVTSRLGDGPIYEHDDALQVARLINHGIPIVLDICGKKDIVGVLDNQGNIIVSAISFRDEGSGIVYHELLLPALAKSTGKLDAVLIWEGGDSISGVRVDNGKVEEYQIDI